MIAHQDAARLDALRSPPKLEHLARQNRLGVVPSRVNRAQFAVFRRRNCHVDRIGLEKRRDLRRALTRRKPFSAVPRSGELSTSNARYLRGVDHCVPLGDLVIDPGLQLVRTRRPGFVAERTEALDYTWFSKQP